MMNILNGIVLVNGSFLDTDINVLDGKIAGFGKTYNTGDGYDAKGLFVIPGFIDTHIHGYKGAEFASADGDFTAVREEFARAGITGFAATVRALPSEDTVAAEKNIVRESRKETKGAKVLGIHLEGPFVSKDRSGAMIPPDEECCVETFERFVKAGEGLLKIMTIAPERENASSVIKRASENGVKISLGHSNADYATTESAVEAGASRVTHLFNAMRPFSHRETGIMGAALTDERLDCELICDLVHNDAPALLLAYRMKGAKGLTLISDTGVMGGLGDGEFVVNGKTRYVRDGVCKNAEGRIAGSTKCVTEGVKNMLKLGVPLADVSLMASGNPAKALGLGEVTGSIKPGLAADMIVCDGELNIKAVFIDGKIVYQE